LALENYVRKLHLDFIVHNLMEIKADDFYHGINVQFSVDENRISISLNWNDQYIKKLENLST